MTSKTLILIISLILLVSQIKSDQNDFRKYQEFITNFQKSFTSIEDIRTKFSNFQMNLLESQYLNFENQKDNYVEENSFGETIFSDMSPEDFSKQYLTFNVQEVQENISGNEITDTDIRETVNNQISNLREQINNAMASASDPAGRNLEENRLLEAVPASYSWVTKGGVNAVKNQGSCGSCWTFATIANIEGLYYKKYKLLYNFSEQQLLDCTPYNDCSGGNVSSAISYIKHLGGLQTTSTYGIYLAKKKTCSFAETKAIVKVYGFYKVGTVETTIRDYLFNNGPLAIAINATPLQFYKGGILTLSNAACNPLILNHAVTLVGYGTSNGIDYWIVRNSWGANWGEKGYFRIKRGSGTCGLNKLVYSAVLV